MVVQEEGWREAAGPAGVSRCGATELTGLGPSGRMCANHNLFSSAAAPSAVWLWCMGREEREREGEALGYEKWGNGVGGAKASRGKGRKWRVFYSFYRSFLASRRICFTSGQCNIKIRVLILIYNLFPPF